MPKGPDCAGQFVSDASPIAVFHKPHAPIENDDVVSSKMPMLPVDAEAVPKGLERGGDRIGFVIADGPQVANKTYAICIARTAFLLGAVPDGMDVLIAMTGAAADTVYDAVNDPSAPILYTNHQELCGRQINPDLKFAKDAKSLTGARMTDGAAASAVSDRSAFLSIATSVVSCCFAGRGAAAGVDWKSSVLRISENANGLRKMVEAASCGMVEMPERLPRVLLESWRKDILDEYLLRSEFAAGEIKGRFRDIFSCLLLPGGDEELHKTARNMMVIADLWRKVPATFDEDLMLEDVNPDATSVLERLSSVGEKIGISSFIEAYVAGVPLDDIFA